MKIIDKTPLLDEKGNLSALQRIQGMLQFGFNWPNELQAQKAIITFFDRNLEKGYTLIRNYTLGQSGIMVPIILLGPTGIYVIQVAHLRGRYEAKGDAWNVAEGEGYKPAPVNLIQRTSRMAAAVRRWIERQGTRVPVEIEPVLIAGDPGLHIESVRPAVKVMMIDGIKSYVSSLATGRPVISTETIYELTERIINPRPSKKEAPSPVVPAQRSTFEEPPQEQTSRARAIYDASQEAKPFDPADFDFAVLENEEPSFEVTPPASNVESSPAQPLPRSKPASNKIFGMELWQLGVLGVLGFIFLILGLVFLYLVLF